jgi:primosomal protein N' (replication factor Y)
VCAECGGTALSSYRPGVTRAREELEALVREPVAAVTAAAQDDLGATRVSIGTDAVLHRAERADLVVFCDLDQELLAPRYRAAEEALAKLVAASRLVGGRSHGGRVVVQTRAPEHEVVQAALRGDPRPVRSAEAARRRLLRLPPAASVALVGREAAQAYVERLGSPLGVRVQGPEDGTWVLRAEDRDLLLDTLAAVERPPGRLRLQVDPPRLG